MATLGLCYLCQRPSARTCRSCAQPVCDRHADETTVGLCVRCAKGMTLE